MESATRLRLHAQSQCCECECDESERSHCEIAMEFYTFFLPEGISKMDPGKTPKWLQ